MTSTTTTNRSYVLWLLTLAYAVHAMEEHAFNWVAWARTVGMSYSWPDFYMANTTVVLFGAIASIVGWRLPAFSLGFPALAAVNALVFHVGASIVAARLNPGAISAVVLFLPLVTVCFISAKRDGVLSVKVLVLSLVVGSAVHAVPLLLLVARSALSY